MTRAHSGGGKLHMLDGDEAFQPDGPLKFGVDWEPRRCPGKARAGRDAQPAPSGAAQLLDPHYTEAVPLPPSFLDALAAAVEQLQ